MNKYNQNMFKFKLSSFFGDMRVNTVFRFRVTQFCIDAFWGPLYERNNFILTTCAPIPPILKQLP